MILSSQELQILVWQGFCQRIRLILVPDLQEHCKLTTKSILLFTSHRLNVLTNLMLCARGYTAPEYAIHGQLSEKVDTYSYGVVVLEIISGQKSSEIKSDTMGEFLLEKVTSKLYVLLYVLQYYLDDSMIHTLPFMALMNRPGNSMRPGGTRSW